MYAEKKCTDGKQRQQYALELATGDYIRTVETGGGGEGKEAIPYYMKHKRQQLSASLIHMSDILHYLKSKLSSICTVVSCGTYDSYSTYNQNTLKYIT